MTTAIATKTLPGLHHVTAITADAQKNIDFYAGILGLRLVKLTVNFDDPGSYHLYYGDELGRPGTIITFFAWPGANRGRVGQPQVTQTAFAVPMDSLAYWAKRLAEKGIEAKPAPDRFGEHALSFTDPDGMQLELISAVESTEPKGHPWTQGPIPAEFAIRGFHSVTLSEANHEKTAQLLTNTMAFGFLGAEQNRFRFRAGNPDNGPGTIVDLLNVPGTGRGSMGAGAVHHVAFRTPDDDQQAAWLQTIAQEHLNVSPVMDRSYFHSIYYREPGGILFEIATGNPGFTADQPADQLGTKLMLPPWLEKHRAEIEQALPPVTLPVRS